MRFAMIAPTEGDAIAAAYPPLPPSPLPASHRRVFLLPGFHLCRVLYGNEPRPRDRLSRDRAGRSSGNPRRDGSRFRGNGRFPPNRRAHPFKRYRHRAVRGRDFVRRVRVSSSRNASRARHIAGSFVGWRSYGCASCRMGARPRIVLSAYRRMRDLRLDRHRRRRLPHRFVSRRQRADSFRPRPPRRKRGHSACFGGGNVGARRRGALARYAQADS